MQKPDEFKQEVKSRFDALSKTYDQITFLRNISLRLAVLAGLRPGDHVLDVATGTGALAISAARTVGRNGKVVGIDLSTEMVALARRKISTENLPQVEVREGDAEHVDFPDQSFDHVTCSLGLFFMPDMLGALREWHRVLKPGGSVGFASFGKGLHQPLLTLWEDRLKAHGLTRKYSHRFRLESPEICRQLLLDAGFQGVEITVEQLGYIIPDAELRWNDIVTGLEGEPLRHLDEVKRNQIKQEHLAELNALNSGDGIFVSVPTIFSFGHKSV